ncbi:endonuclease/exonuclease/phosphatase family protein [Arthrobacter sp. BB-1]|uniref:endonuclease/exonuclease/phosphatase family protein n=1 Tax=unclassified Arthrobacter TaxID=235627 RepID=UPI0011124567|nr:MULTISPECIES: endonuclease/exonuclease/phosphatase family protein [unclassified Arthrobacter]TNB72198.1 endonuclease/exonuclease/phosphatase family protein [Arthrobacter sp. BB-1]
MANSARLRAALRPGRAYTWLWFLLTVPLVGLSVLRAIPAVWPLRGIQLLAFTPWLAAPAAAALLLALLGRNRWHAAVSSALLACLAFWLFPLPAGKRVPGDGPTVELRVMTFNSKLGQADARTVVRLVRENRIDVLAVQEHSQAFQERLAAEGLAALLPESVTDPADNAGGSAVYSRFPLEETGRVGGTAFRMPILRITVTSQGRAGVLEVTNVHTRAPVEHMAGQWRGDLAAVGRVAAGGGSRLLIGDFNATYDHAEFRSLLRGGDGQGLVDVGVAAGARLVPTWPMDGQLLPGVTIDHVVTSPDIWSSSYAVHRVDGSDHAAITAVLDVPAR